MLIHKTCAVCESAEWDVDVHPDPDHCAEPGYMRLYEATNRLIEGAKGICPSCEKRHSLEEMNQRLNQAIQDAVAAEFISSETPRCTFATSKPEVEAMNAGWQTARELAFDARFAGTASAFIYGPTGTGKTYLSHCLLNAAAQDRGYGAVGEITARRYIHAIITNDPRVWRLQRVFFLLLDDIDKAIWKAETIQMLWELLDVRKNGLFTAITSNADPLAFSKMLKDACPGNTSIAEATMERLNPCIKLKIDGTSLRRKAG